MPLPAATIWVIRPDDWDGVGEFLCVEQKVE
jgi:hypothetical protein